MAEYGDVLAANLRAFRTRKGVSQDLLGQRMKALGYTVWRSQTVARAESGQRRLTAEEILGLAAALEVTMRQLLAPQPDDKVVEFPSGESIEVLSVQRSLSGTFDGAVTWDGAKHTIGPVPDAGRWGED